MVPGLESLVTATGTGYHFYRVPPALVAQAENSEPYLEFGEPGTGGTADWAFWQRRFGYGAIPVAAPERAAPAVGAAQQSMQTVREGLGRTMSYLPEVFGVSRQTLYNWLSGDKAPSPEHEDKIRQLEAAAKRFMELGFRPASSHLTRTLTQGKSFLEILAAGGEGAMAADKLVRLVQRGQSSRARLEELLAGRKAAGPLTDALPPVMDDDAARA
jgi:transcriptional regulator with XRE-family HTH domain